MASQEVKIRVYNYSADFSKFPAGCTIQDVTVEFDDKLSLSGIGFDNAQSIVQQWFKETYGFNPNIYADLAINPENNKETPPRELIINPQTTTPKTVTESTGAVITYTVDYNLISGETLEYAWYRYTADFNSKVKLAGTTNSLNVAWDTYGDEYNYLNFVMSVTVKKDGVAEGEETFSVPQYVTFADPQARADLLVVLNTANSKVEADYTPTSWSSFVTVRTTSQAVYNDTNKTRAEYTTAKTNLQTAINNLVLRANKTSLNAKISEANALVQTNYTANSWTTMVNARTSAITVRDNLNATQAQVDSATTALNNAINALVNIATLRNTVNTSTVSNPDLYTPNSYTAYQTAYTTATTTLANAAATTVQVTSANSGLVSAFAALTLRANVTALNTSISTSQALVQANYSANSWATHTTQLNNAITTRDNLNATQSQVDTAKTNLDNARNALVDLRPLQAKISEADLLVEADYSPETWAVFDSALTQAKTALASPAVTAATVNSEVSLLTSAIEQLLPPSEPEVPEE